MYYTADLLTARRVLGELRAARAAERAAALSCLQRLRNEVASERADDRARLTAWSSIRALYDVVKSGQGDLKPYWQDAITKTEAWSESLR